ncbi:MAG: SHOCT domain-containing protein [Balneolaceae bacterium]|nr:SHOCT domain-containing protein [Balneolaceae bacterium]
MHWFNGLGGPWMMVLWWILIIAVTVAVVKFVLPGNRRPPEKSALEILKERYARGEIDKEEFEQKKRDLLD